MKERRKGMLLVVSGPSGTGKGTLCERLLRSDPTIMFGVSATTRKPRIGGEGNNTLWANSLRIRRRLVRSYARKPTAILYSVIACHITP